MLANPVLISSYTFWLIKLICFLYSIQATNIGLLHLTYFIKCFLIAFFQANI